MNQEHSSYQELKDAKQAKRATGVILVTEGLAFSCFLGMTILAMREHNYIIALLCAIPTSVGAIGATHSCYLFQELKRDIEKLKREQKNQNAK